MLTLKTLPVSIAFDDMDLLTILFAVYPGKENSSVLSACMYSTWKFYWRIKMPAHKKTKLPGNFSTFLVCEFIGLVSFLLPFCAFVVF